MEQYVYFSIMFFSLIIFFLYFYIMYEKIIEAIKIKRIKSYSKKLVPYIDFIINKLIAGEDLWFQRINNLKRICKNKAKREITIENLIYYLENYNGEFTSKIISLCEYIEILEYEINNLNNKNHLKKATAAKRLGEFRSEKAIKALLKELPTANNDVKYNILLALAKIGEEASFMEAFKSIDATIILSERSLIEIVDSFNGDKAPLYKYMINSSNTFIASVFIKSAGNSKDVSLSYDISKFLYNENKELRIAAVKALGNIGNEVFIEDMLKLLEDTEWEVRAVTSKALKNFTDDKILLPLCNAISDSQWYVRYNAANSLLSHKKGIAMASQVFDNEDKFAKDIIISAIENSPNIDLNFYENSGAVDEKDLALKVKKYIELKQGILK